MGSWKSEVLIISLENYITVEVRSQACAPCDYEFLELSVFSWRNWKVDFFSRPRIKKRTSVPRCPRNFSRGQKKKILSLENSASKIFFCMGRLRSTGFHDFRFSTRFWGRLSFLWNHERLSNYTTHKITVLALHFFFRIWISSKIEVASAFWNP